MKNIVLLHGALGFSGDLTALTGSLENTGFNTHAFSFSGHGNTPFKAGFGIRHFAAELQEFLREKELKDVCVFGYSMGGFVALQHALEYPGGIQKIITLGTKFNWSKESVDKETRMLVPSAIEEKVPAFAKLLEAKHGPSWKELLTKTADLMREINILNLLNKDELKQIAIPVLLGLADKDQMVSLDETVNVFKTLPAASMYMLPDTKHQVESASTALLTKLIQDFILKN